MSHDTVQTPASTADGHIVTTLRRRCALAAWLGVIAVLAGSLWLPRTYELGITIERRLADPAHARDAATAPADAWRPRLVNELLEPADARAIARRVAAGRVDATYRHLHQHVHVRPMAAAHGAARVRLSYVGPDPLLGRRLLDAIARRHVTNANAGQRKSQANAQPAEPMPSRKGEAIAAAPRVEAEASATEQSTPDRAVDRAALAARQSREALKAFEREYEQALGASPADAQAQLREAQAKLAELQHQHDAVLTRIETLEAALARTPVRLREQVFEVNARHLELAGRKQALADLINWLIVTRRMRAAHPTMTEIVKRYRQVKRGLRAAPRRVLTAERFIDNPGHQTLRARLHATEAQAQALAGRIADQRTQWQRWAERVARARALARRHATLQRQWRAAAQQAHLAEAYTDIEQPTESSEAAQPAGQTGQRVGSSSRAYFAYAAPTQTDYQLRWPSVEFVGVAAVVVGLFAAMIALFLPVPAPVDVTRKRSRPGAAVAWLTRHTAAALTRPAGAILLTATVVALSGLTYLRLEQPTLIDHLQRQTPTWLTAPDAPADRPAAVTSSTAESAPLASK